MWCFFDESYPDGNSNVTALSACLMHFGSVPILDRILYTARKRHFGMANAKDLHAELKGNQLFSNNSFKMAAKFGSSTNLEAATTVFEKCMEHQKRHPILVFGAVAYGEKSILKQLGSKKLSKPVADILDKVSSAATQMSLRGTVNLVFDSQICGDEHNIAASVRRFVAGVRLSNVSPYPLVGVSHVSPGIQFADMCAYLLARTACGDTRLPPWYDRMCQLEWHGTVNGFNRNGIQAWEKRDGVGFVVKKNWK